MKIIFFDADGTICHLRNGVSAKNMKTLFLLNKLGYYTVLCTSRSMPFVTEDIRTLGFDAYITSGGASIRIKDKLIDYTLPFGAVTSILSFLEKYDLVPILCGQESILFDPKALDSTIDPWFDVIFEQTRDYFIPLSKYDENISINKICVKVGKSGFRLSEAEDLFDCIRLVYPCEITPGCDSDGNLVEFEITSYGRNKGEAVKELIQKLQKKDETITSWAIGDGTADISMFQNVDYSIAMGNASDIVKEAANFVTDSYECDGMSVACEKIILTKDAYDEILEFTDVSTDGILGFERFLIFDKADWFDMFVKKKPIPPIQVDWQLSSVCNLRCRWCVGRNVNADNGFTLLCDNMNLEKIDNIAEHISQLCISGIKIETVQFSGFTGEPLIHWKLLKRAIEILKSNGIRIGVFTNGTLMDEKTWKTLTDIESVHISIDGGRDTWAKIKNPYNSTVDYSDIIYNIQGLIKQRNDSRSSTEINTGYTVTQENITELENTIQDLVKIGADSICVKYDITGNEELMSQQECESIIEKCYNKFNSKDFKVLVMHDKVPKNDSKRWECGKGCYYNYFFCTIGSDGNIYPCDYQTLNGCPSFGNINNTSFEDIFELKKSTCAEIISSKQGFRNVCPPLAEVINPYLHKVLRLVNIYGSDIIISAFQMIRKEYR